MEVPWKCHGRVMERVSYTGSLGAGRLLGGAQEHEPAAAGGAPSEEDTPISDPKHHPRTPGERHIFQVEEK